MSDTEAQEPHSAPRLGSTCVELTGVRPPAKVIRPCPLGWSLSAIRDTAAISHHIQVKPARYVEFPRQTFKALSWRGPASCSARGVRFRTARTGSAFLPSNLSSVRRASQAFYKCCRLFGVRGRCLNLVVVLSDGNANQPGGEVGELVPWHEFSQLMGIIG